MHELTLLRNGTRTLRGIVRELLPDGDCRDAILDLILLAYRSARDEVAGMEEAVETYGRAPLPLDERLDWDPAVSDQSPVIKGTWITVSQVMGLLREGWSWSDILRTHPEMNEDDLKACLSHTIHAEAA